MNGYFSEKALERFAEMAAQVQPAEFAEGDTYDFTRCVRPNGTAYGTAGKCRKGTEEEKIEEPGTRKKKVLEANMSKSTKQAVEGLSKKVSDYLKSTQKSPVKSKSVEGEKKTSDETTSVESVRGGKVTDQKLKKAFDKALLNLEKAEKRGDGEAEYRAQESINLLRRAYHAENREEFIKISTEISRNSRRAAELRNQATREAKAEGRTIPQLHPSHPSRKKWQEASDLDSKQNDLKEKRDAAYYGEPSKTSPLRPQGEGKVSTAVPSSLPRGGADKKLKEFLDGSEVVMAFPTSGFNNFVEQGRAKNGFEPGTDGIKTGNRFYLDLRRKGEKEVLDIPRDANPSERPIYAALEHPDRSRSLQGGQGSLMAQYGGVQVVLNDSVKDRSTFTYGDSIDFNEPRGVKASPVRDPANPKSFGKKSQISFDGDNPHSKRMTIMTSRDESKVTPPYMETQIHGGLKLSDVKEVRYYRGNEIDPKVRNLLEQQGVKVVELPPQIRDLDIRPDHPNFSNIETISPPRNF